MGVLEEPRLEAYRYSTEEPYWPPSLAEEQIQKDRQQ